MDEINSLKNEIDALKMQITNFEIASHKHVKQSQDNSELMESHTRFETVFESSMLGNKIISSDLIILQVNPAMVEMLGYTSKEEILGTKILDFTPLENRKDWAILQENLWKKNTPSFSLETCLQRKDGSIICCQVTSILFQDNGETLGYTIIEDITEKQKLRRQKEDFISVASHELKTPITTLKATLQLMSRLIENEHGVADKLKALSKNAETNVIKLGNLVINLLDATKLEQGQLSLNKTKFKVSEMVEKCCTHIRHDNKHKIVLQGDLSLEICADEEKIDQVIVNLVNNAVKYASQSKEIIIKIEELATCSKVSVIDKGPGISPDDKLKLFDRYFRVNKNGNHGSGLGLGLYISSEIIKRHEGHMGVESKPGEGSSFWFIIPLANTPVGEC